METFISAPYQFWMPFDAENHVDMPDFSATLLNGLLYESIALSYQSEQDQSNDVFSSMHHFHDEKTPIHRFFDVKVKPTHLPEALRSKAVVAICNAGRPDNCGGQWDGDWLRGRSRSFGDYCVMADTLAPRITAVSFSPDMRRKSSISFRLSDNFATTGLAKDIQYRGTIDGQWVLFEYDKKRSRITYTFDENLGKGPHKVRITAVDDRGNEGVFEGKFTR